MSRVLDWAYADREAVSPWYSLAISQVMRCRKGQSAERKNGLTILGSE